MGIVAKYKFNQNTYANFIPTFNSGFTYTINDEIDTDGYTIRTIESDSLPTLMRFGATTQTDREKSLLEVYGCNTENVNTMYAMFNNCSSLTSLDASNFNTEKVTTMQDMFSNCFSLTSLDVSNFNTSQVTNMYTMFYSCSSLTSLDISHFDTSNVPNMSWMFHNCSSLTSLDVSSFDTSQVANMSYMFNNCSSLTSLDVSNFNTSNVSNMGSMFANCSLLTSLDVSNFNTKKVTNIGGMFYNCSSLTSLDVSNFDTSQVTSMINMFNNTNNLTDMGAIYCNSLTINKISSLITTNTKIYYSLPDISELESHDNIEYVKYIFPTKIQLPPHIQLHSLPDGTCDELDIKTGILTRKIGKFIINEKTPLNSFKSDNNGTYFYIRQEILNSLIKVDAEIISNILSNTTYDLVTYPTYNGIHFTTQGHLQFRFLNKKNITRNDFLLYLSKNPIIIYYILNEPIIEKLILNYNNSCNYGVILPRGASDNYNVITNEYKQNLDFIPIDGSIAFDTATIKDTTVKYSVALSKFEVDTANVRGSDGIYCNNDLFKYEVSDNDYEHAYIENDTTLHVYVNKNRLSSYDQVGFQMYLTNNPFDLYYAMRNTIISYVNYEDLNPEKASWEMLDCTEDGSITIESGNMDKTLLLDCLDYVAPTKNRFEIDLLKANTQYTVYVEGVSGRIQLNFGGNIVNFTSGNIYTSGETQLVEFYTDNEIKNLIIVEGDTRNETIEFFEGLTSSENITVISSNSDENESNEISYEGITLRSLPNGVKDEINVLTGEYIQRVGEVVLDGSENWVKYSTKTNVSFYYYYIDNLYGGNNWGVNDIINDKLEQVALGIVIPSESWEDNKITAIGGYLNGSHGIGLFKSIATVHELQQYLQQNPITVQYELTQPIIHQLDAQSLTPYQDGYISMESEVNYPSFIYSLPSTNTFYIPKIKNMTQYTLKYPVGSGTVTIGNIQYNVTSDSMLFTTPIEITGDKNSLVFETDDNPTDIMILEGNYSNREVKYFTGINSVINPTIRVTNSLTGGSVEYKGNSDIALYSLPNKMSDKLDVLTGYLVRVTGVREYQDGDYELDNVFTDGINTVYKLDSPLLYRNINFPIPTLNGYGTIELDSDEAIPQFNYRTLSSNHYPLELLEPNSTYTMIGEAQANTTFTLGGTYVGNYSGGKLVVNLGTVTEKSLKFSNDIGLKNFMLVKDDATNSTLPFYTGIKSVEDVTFNIKGFDGQENSLVLGDSIVLRKCGNVYDSIDLINGVMTKQLNEIVLTGTEYWSVETSKSVDSNYQLFSLATTSAKDSKNATIYCDKLSHNYLATSLNNQECIYFENNKLYLCIKKLTIGGDNVNALKTWLTKNNMTIIYPLINSVKLDLDVVWEVTPPISYETQTEFDTEVALGSLKPILAVTVATTTLEEIVSDLNAKNRQLEAESLVTMLAVTEVYEMIYGGATTMSLKDSVESKPTVMSINEIEEEIEQTAMGKIYVKLIKAGMKSIEQVPYFLQEEVIYYLNKE